MKTKHLFLILFLLFQVSKLTAANDFSHPLVLSELVDIALQNNPQTKQAWWSAHRAASAVGSAKSNYYPKIGFTANAMNGRDFKFINGPDVSYTIVDADLTLSMILYDFGERAAGVQEAKMALLAADWKNNWTMQSVMLEVLENAYSTLHSQMTLEAALSSTKDAEQILKAAEELHRAGLSPITDVYSSRTTFAEMQMDIAEKKSSHRIQKAKLAASLGIDLETLFELAPITYLPSANEINTRALICLAQQQRADLMAKRAQLAGVRATQKKIKSLYRPKLSLSSRGGMEHAVDDNTQGGHYNVTLNLDIPLFTGFDRLYQNRMAYADSRLTGEELAELELSIALDVLTQSSLLEAAQEMMQNGDEYLKNAEMAYSGTLEKYKAGKEQITQVSNAQIQLADARVRYSEIKTRLLVSIANLAYSTGTIGSNRESSCLKNH